MLIWLGPLLVVREMVVFYRTFRVSDVNVAVEVLGYAVLVAGWLTLPGRMSRRGGAAAIAVVSLLAYAHGLPSSMSRGWGQAYEVVLHGYFGVAAQLIAIIGMLAAWLLVRERPSLTWTLLPAGVLVHVAFLGRGVYFFDTLLPGVQLADWQSSMTLRLALGWVVLIAVPAWAARLLTPRIAQAAAARRIERMAREAALIEQRAQPREASTAFGATAAAAGGPSQTTNTFAILALIFGILGGYLAVVFGHIAKSQIRKTGQRGSGMATAGLVLGYIWVAVTVAFVVYVMVVVAQVSG